MVNSKRRQLFVIYVSLRLRCLRRSCLKSHKTEVPFFLPVSPHEFYDRLFSYSQVFVNHDNIPVPCDASIIISAAGRASLSDTVIKIQSKVKLLGDSLQNLKSLPMYIRGTAAFISTVYEVAKNKHAL
jgi:hypothetical protein